MSVAKRMLNIRLEEEDINKIMSIAAALKTTRRDYRVGAATVIEAVVKYALSSPELLSELFSDVLGDMRPFASASGKAAS